MFLNSNEPPSSLLFWLLNLFLIFFSTIILAYTSMSTGLGPFVAPTIILLIGLGASVFLIKKNQLEPWMFFLQQGASLAGLTATATGFILPTFYFLDKEAFLKLTSSFQLFYPVIFFITIFGLLWGYAWGLIFFKYYFNNYGNFTVPKMLKNMIIDLEYGLERYFFAGSFLSGLLVLTKWIFIKIHPTISAFQFYPSMMAVGFSLGFKNIKSFIFGFFFRYLFLNQVPILIGLDNTIFSTAGIVSAILFLDIFIAITSFFIKNINFDLSQSLKKAQEFLQKESTSTNNIVEVSFLIFLIFMISVGAVQQGFSISVITFTLILSIPIIFKASEFAVEFGLLPFGRFATFVMLPVFLLFRTNHLSLILISLFVAVSCAGSVNYLFNYKLASYLEISAQKASFNQVLSIFFTSAFIAIIFLLLFQKFQPGSTELFAHRGLSRAMLIQSFQVNYFDIFLGSIIFVFLKYYKMSEMIFFNTLLMPPALSFSLFGGSLFAKFIKQNKETDFFSVGIFAGESILTLILQII